MDDTSHRGEKSRKIISAQRFGFFRLGCGLAMNEQTPKEVPVMFCFDNTPVCYYVLILPPGEPHTTYHLWCSVGRRRQRHHDGLQPFSQVCEVHYCQIFSIKLSYV